MGMSNPAEYFSNRTNVLHPKGLWVTAYFSANIPKDAFELEPTPGIFPLATVYIFFPVSGYFVFVPA